MHHYSSSYRNFNTKQHLRNQLIFKYTFLWEQLERFQNIENILAASEARKKVYTPTQKKRFLPKTYLPHKYENINCINTNKYRQKMLHSFLRKMLSISAVFQQILQVDFGLFDKYIKRK